MGDMNAVMTTAKLNEEDLSDAIHTMNTDDFDMFISNLKVVLDSLHHPRQIGHAVREVHVIKINDLCLGQLKKLQLKQPVGAIKEERV